MSDDRGKEKLEIGNWKLGDEGRNWKLGRTAQKHEGQILNFELVLELVLWCSIEWCSGVRLLCFTRNDKKRGS